MRRSTLILIIVLILVLAGAGVWFWFNQGALKSILNRSTVNTNTTTTGNLNRAPVTGTIPNVVEGNQALTGTVKVHEVTVTLTSLLKTKSFESIGADKGKTYIVIYFQPVASTDVLKVKQGLEANAHVLAGTTVIPLDSIKVASDQVKNDRGYIKFVVLDTATNLQLEVGSGSAAQHVKLP